MEIKTITEGNEKGREQVLEAVRSGVQGIIYATDNCCKGHFDVSQLRDSAVKIFWTNSCGGWKDGLHDFEGGSKIYVPPFAFPKSLKKDAQGRWQYEESPLFGYSIGPQEELSSRAERLAQDQFARIREIKTSEDLAILIARQPLVRALAEFGQGQYLERFDHGFGLEPVPGGYR